MKLCRYFIIHKCVRMCLELEGVNQGDPKWEPGYVHYANRGCYGRDEIFLGHTNGRTDCRLKCDAVSNCVSFEWWEQTEECHVSSSCTYEKSVAIDWTPVDLYVASKGTGMPYTFEMNIYNTLYQNLNSTSMSFFFILTGAPSKCADIDHDVGFVLDNSGSMKEEHWEMEKEFVKELDRSLRISPTGSHAAVVLFADEAKLAIKFNDYPTVHSFESAIDRITRLNGGTRIDKGLSLAFNEMFRESNGMRPNSIKTLVLVTDGKNTPDSPLMADKFKYLAKARNIRLLVIAAGSANTANLIKLVDREEDLKHITDVSELQESAFFKGVEETLCNGEKIRNYIQLS